MTSSSNSLNVRKGSKAPEEILPEVNIFAKDRKGNQDPYNMTHGFPTNSAYKMKDLVQNNFMKESLRKRIVKNQEM